MAYAYLVRCADGSLYAGWTTDVEARVKFHNSGKGAKYTRSRLPVCLAWSYYTESKIIAQRLEAAVKKLSKEKKELLVETPKLAETYFADILGG